MVHFNFQNPEIQILKFAVSTVIISNRQLFLDKSKKINEAHFEYLWKLSQL